MSISLPEVVFAFAPKSGYFFEYKDIRKWSNIPKGLLDLLEGRKEDKLKKTFSMAFDGDGGWICVYENQNGEAKYTGEKIPPELRYWIDGDDERDGIFPKLKICSLDVSFGERSGMFFASANGVDSDLTDNCRYHIWQKVEWIAERALQRILASGTSWNVQNAAWRVSFGKYGAFVIHPLSGDGNITSLRAIKVSYTSLNTLLTNNGTQYIRTVVLNPFIESEYFLLRMDGTAEWIVNASYCDLIKGLAERILRDQSVHGSTTLSQQLKRPAEENLDVAWEEKRIKMEE